MLDALADMRTEINADNFLRDSKCCEGRGTCEHDAPQPSRVGETVADVEGIDYTILQLKANIVFDTLDDVWAEPLVDTLA